MPTLHLIAGPNGVGKTTFADRFLPQTIKELEFVNADLIARGLSPYDPDSISMEAGRIALERIRQRVCNTWKLFENDRNAPRLLAVEKDGKLAIRDEKAVEKINRETGITL